jgi:hypothetical protein
VLITITVLLLSACTSSAPKHQTGPCQAGCTGVIDGAHYLIKVPANWNGTLLIFSHGYQFAGHLRLQLSPQDKAGTGDDGLSAALLNKGYALAGSSWSSTGWAVQDGVDAANQLYQRFVKAVRKPTRAYAWGRSLGGLVTELLAEQAGWVDGAAPMCGVVGGPLPNFDNWLEALVATQALLGPKFTYTGTMSATQLKTETTEAISAINAARTDRSGGGAAKLVYIADLLGLPDKSLLFSRTGQANEIGAADQNLAAWYIKYGIQILGAARAQFGGNPAKTFPATDVSLTPAQRALITALHGNPAAYAAKVDAAPSVRTSAAARRKLIASGNPTGNLRVPTLTLHGLDDPLAIAANETILRSLVAKQKQTKRLKQVFVGPYQDQPGFSLGHCAFSAGEEVGLIDTLDQWVRQGPRPASNMIADNFGPALDATYKSSEWPSGAVH